jgi:hypothetical protein
MVPRIPSSSSLWACALIGLLSLGAVLWWTPPAESIAPLGYTWSCTSRYCSFSVTTNYHGAYQWGFGDGNVSSKSTSKTANHFYNIPVDNQFHSFNVTLVGYATLNTGSPDNIISCTITVAAANFGIGTGGSCS